MRTGWVNSCGVELFTHGWVKCDESNQFVGRRKPLVSKHYKKKEDYRLGLDYLDINNNLEYNKVIEVINGVEVTIEKPIEPVLSLTELETSIESIKDPIEKELAQLLRANKEHEYNMLQFKYIEEMKKLDEEVFFIVLALDDEGF